jgi:outer membrane protein assembly factor BamB
MGILNWLFGRKKEDEPLPSDNRKSVVAPTDQAEDSTNVDDLIKDLRDPIRWKRAAKKLGELRNHQAVIPLIQAIERWDVKVTDSGYRIVIRSISTIGLSAIEPIAGLIHKCSEYENCVATDALKELVASGDIETLDQLTRSERLISFLESCRPPLTVFSPSCAYYSDVMEIMATALGKLAASGDKQVLERLPTFLRLCEAWHKPPETIGLFLSNMLATEGGKEAMTLVVESGDPRLCVFIEKANLASLKPEIQNHISAAMETLRAQKVTETDPPEKPSKTSPSTTQPVVQSNEDVIFKPVCLNCRKPMNSIRVPLVAGFAGGNSRCPACGEDHTYTVAQGKLTLSRVSVPIGFRVPVEQIIEPSEHALADGKVDTGTVTAKEVIDFGLALPLNSRAQYFKEVGDKLSSFSSGDIINAARYLSKPLHPYRLAILLSALAKNLIDNREFYLWYFLATDFFALQMPKQGSACAQTALSFDHPGGISGDIYEDLKDWKTHEPSAQQEKFRTVADELASRIPSTPDEIYDLLKKIIEIPDLTYQRWEYLCRRIRGFSAIGDKTIVLVDNGLHCLSLQEGKLLWKVLANSMDKYGSSNDVIAQANRLYVRAKDGVYCLRLDTGDILWNYYDDDVRSICLWYNNVIAILKEGVAELRCDNGAVEWHTSVPPVWGHAMFGDQLFLTSKGDSSGRYLLTSIDVKGRREMWGGSFQSHASQVPCGLEGDTVLLNCGHPGNEFIALDTLTGQRKWQLEHKQKGTAQFVSVNGPAIIIESNFDYPEGSTLQAVSLKDGSVLWKLGKFSGGDRNITWNCGMRLDDVLVCTPEIYNGSSYVAGFRCEDGKEVFSYDTGYQCFFLAGIGNKFFVRIGKAIRAYDKIGTLLWKSEIPHYYYARVYVPYTPSTKRLWVGSWDDERYSRAPGTETLTCFDVDTGATVASFDCPHPVYFDEPGPLFVDESTAMLWWRGSVKLLTI